MGIHFHTQHEYEDGAHLHKNCPSSMESSNLSSQTKAITPKQTPFKTDGLQHKHCLISIPPCYNEG
jgi:hypothetical protein